MDPIICPYEDCDGLLILGVAIKTAAGFIAPDGPALDENEVWETYACNVCGREVSRHWKWSAVEKNEEAHTKPQNKAYSEPGRYRRVVNAPGLASTERLTKCTNV